MVVTSELQRKQRAVASNLYRKSKQICDEKKQHLCNPSMDQNTSFPESRTVVEAASGNESPMDCQNEDVITNKVIAHDSMVVQKWSNHGISEWMLSSVEHGPLYFLVIFQSNWKMDFLPYLLHHAMEILQMFASLNMNGNNHTTHSIKSKSLDAIWNENVITIEKTSISSSADFSFGMLNQSALCHILGHRIIKEIYNQLGWQEVYFFPVGETLCEVN